MKGTAKVCCTYHALATEKRFASFTAFGSRGKGCYMYHSYGEPGEAASVCVLVFHTLCRLAREGCQTYSAFSKPGGAASVCVNIFDSACVRTKAVVLVLPLASLGELHSCMCMSLTYSCMCTRQGSRTFPAWNFPRRAAFVCVVVCDEFLQVCE